MATDQASHEYRVALVEPDRRTVLVQGPIGDRSLPSVRIPHCCRRTQELRAAIYDQWGLCAFVVDYVGDDAPAPCVVAEVRNADQTSELTAGNLDQVRDGELPPGYCEPWR